MATWSCNRRLGLAQTARRYPTSTLSWDLRHHVFQHTADLYAVCRCFHDIYHCFWHRLPSSYYSHRKGKRTGFGKINLIPTAALADFIEFSAAESSQSSKPIDLIGQLENKVRIPLRKTQRILLFTLMEFFLESIFQCLDFLIEDYGYDGRRI